MLQKSTAVLQKFCASYACVVDVAKVYFSLSHIVRMLLADWMAGWLAAWLASWLTSKLAGCLPACLAGCVAGPYDFGAGAARAAWGPEIYEF